MGTRKTNVSEPPLKCRDLGSDIETGVSMRSRDESGGCPFIGQAVSGMQAARAWSAASARNLGRHVPILSSRTRCEIGAGERERAEQQKL